MKSYLLSERIKLKRQGHLVLQFVAAFLAFFLAILFVGPEFVPIFAFYWWEALFFPMLLALFFLSNYKMEEQAGKFQNVEYGQKKSKILFAKYLLLVGQACLSQLFFLVLDFIVCFVFGGAFSLLHLPLALFCLVVTSSWVYLVLFLLSRKFSVYISLLIYMFTSFILGSFLGKFPIWVLLPFTYPYKVGEVLLLVKPSGDFYSVGSQPSLSILLLSICLSILVTYLLVIYVKKKEGSR